jgi:hypothetical protein
MADLLEPDLPEDSSTNDEPNDARREKESNPEAATLIERALAHVREGKHLPPPETWEEVLAGMAAWLVRKWSDEDGQRPCGNCGSRDWEFGAVVSVDADPRWPTPEGLSGSYPYFQVGCRECGNTLFINALSVFEPQQPQGSAPPDTPGQS